MGAIEAWSPELQAEYEWLTEDRTGREHPLAFTQRISPHLMASKGHHRLISELVAAAREKPIRALLSLPPRHGKTTQLNHGLAWWLANDPADTCGYFSYSDTQGERKSRLIRQVATRAGVRLAADARNLSAWRTLHGGGLLAGGVKGQLTGEGVHGLFVIDDPYPNRKMADSVAYREEVWEWFWEVAYTRKEGASYIIVHTRWHEDDLIGRLKEDPDWTYINVPALAEHNDILGRKEGDALWPEKIPKSELVEYQAKNAWSFSALYQGSPRPRGGQVFGEPARFSLRDFNIEGCRACIAVDPAATSKTASDHSAIITIAMKGYGDQTTAYILDVQRFQCSVPQLARNIRDIQKRRRLWVVVEAVGGFKAVPDTLREMVPGMAIHEINPTTDKFIRAQPMATAWNSGRVLVPEDAPWVDEYLSEMRRFTGVGDKEDDQVDASAHGFNALYQERVPNRKGSRRGNELAFA